MIKMSEKLTLLNDSSDSEIELTVNKDYANRYGKWREREQLQKYKDLLKDKEDSESSESEGIDQDFYKEFFRAFSLLKGKDPRLYDKNFQLFKEKHPVKEANTEKQKPIYMKDYERNLVLERDGKFSDEDVPEKITTYNEEQEQLKKSFKEAIDESDDSDVDDLLQVKTKSKREEEHEEEDYIKWLKGEKKEIAEDLKQDLSHLKNYWNDPKLDEDEKFLRDYILNKRYLEKVNIIPSYEEITSGRLSDDEKTIEKQDKFEHKYNSRFENPDKEFIKRYPRTINDSLRRTDNRRKEKREEIAERKRKQRDQRREKLKCLKALKKKEIEEKFMKLKEISGLDDINLNESDIGGDFDPDKYDQIMSVMFDDEYYAREEKEMDFKNWNTWAGKKIIEENENGENLSDKDENNVNENESIENPNNVFANEMISASSPKKKVKKKSLFAKRISQKNAVYDPNGKSFNEYLDEYYKLDYEDVIGDMPVRYKYRKVIPNDFGLTVDEILAANEKELNRWCPLKKTSQYRNDDEELYDVQAYQKKAQNTRLKQKCLPSVFAVKSDIDSGVMNCKSFKGRKKDNDINNSENIKIETESTVQFSESEDLTQIDDQNVDLPSETKGSRKKSKKNKGKLNKSISKSNESTDLAQIGIIDQNDQGSDSDLKGVQSQEQIKKLKKKKHKEKQNISEMEVESDDCAETNHKFTKKKRKYSDLSIISDLEHVHDDITSPIPSSKSEKKQLSHSNEIRNSGLNTISKASVSADISEMPSKQKKKNMHKENGNIASIQQSTSNQSYKSKKSKDKYKKFISEDKRLGISDERLAAYGINPKKFKNRIIYSKK